MMGAAAMGCSAMGQQRCEATGCGDGGAAATTAGGGVTEVVGVGRSGERPTLVVRERRCEK
jgi:hypothetical protein